MDKRIHFALNCGAKSCPPIKVYTPEALEEGLQSAAAAFCEGLPSSHLISFHLSSSLQAFHQTSSPFIDKRRSPSKVLQYPDICVYTMQFKSADSLRPVQIDDG